MSEATGARVDIEMTVGKDAAQMWELITDVSRIGEFSPECTGAAWLTESATGPRPGDRFSGHNEYGSGFASDVTCVVTAAERPSVFEWIVLDPSADPAIPGSIWRYELVPGAGGQLTVRHSFEHGPGVTGLSEGMRQSPDQAQSVLDGRLDILRKHMTITLDAMAAS